MKPDVFRSCSVRFLLLLQKINKPQNTWCKGRMLLIDAANSTRKISFYTWPKGGRDLRGFPVVSLAELSVKAFVSKFLFYCFILFMWLHWFLAVAHRIFISPCRIFSCSTWTLGCGMGDLVPWPRMEPRPPAWRVGYLSHWATREAPMLKFLVDAFVSLLWSLMSQLWQMRNKRR